MLAPPKLTAQKYKANFDIIRASFASASSL